MSYQATVIEILIAGPGDVLEERLEVVDAIETWNQRHARQMGILMRPVTWETDTYPELGDDSQAIVNRQTAGRCSAVIAVFATRLGTATPRAVSGTAEEIQRFVAEGKPVSLYFSKGQVDLTRLDIKQLEALRLYKESIKNSGLYGSYESISDFRDRIDQRLVALGYRFQAQQNADEPEQVGARTDFEPTEIDMRVIAAVGRLMTEGSRDQVNSLVLQREPELSGVSSESIFESLRVLEGLALVAKANDQGRWDVGLTSDGIEMWLLNFVPNYPRVRRQIAVAIVTDGIRNPALVPGKTGVPRLIVEHVLGRWVDRGLVIINRLYDGMRIDRFSQQIDRLARESVDIGRSGEESASMSNAENQAPRYRNVEEYIGVDVVALSSFGGELGDAVAAAIRVDGFSVVQVVAPSARSTWGPQVEDQFRSEVRRLATSHDLLDRHGEVRLVFDPPQSSLETKDGTSGEFVERRG